MADEPVNTNEPDSGLGSMPDNTITKDSDIFNISEYIAEDGNFSDSFKEAAKKALGEDYQNSEVFKNINSGYDLIKSFADTKTAYGKKLEGYIKKPAEDASDEEKAQFKAQLAELLGKPEKPEDYNIPKPETLPEGMGWDENFEASFRELFHKLDVPASTAEALSNAYNKYQIDTYNSMMQKMQEDYNAAAEKLDTEWTGENSVKNNRLAYKAMMQFGTDEFKKLLADSGVNASDASIKDHTIWQKLGCSPSHRKVWYNIGKAMQSDTAIGDNGLPSNNKQDDLLGKFYDHPTSKELLRKD